MNNPWKTLESKVVYTSKYGYILKEDRVLNPKGNPGTYIVLEKKTPVVTILPVTSDGRVILVNQWRYTIGKASLEVPAGGLDMKETAVAAAARELQEETGCRGKLELLGEMYEGNGVANIKMFAFIATDILMGNSNPEDEEAFEIVKLPLASVLELVLNGKIDDIRTIATVLMARKIKSTGQVVETRMNKLETGLSGVLDLTRVTNVDDRGFFREVFHLDELEKELGYEFRILQMNHSRSFPGVIRALHAENWNKLIYPVSGEMLAVLADIRPNSPTFGKTVKFNFGENDRHALFIPIGIANSVCVIGDKPVEYIYLVDAYYTGKDTTAVAWDDPDLNIDWPVKNPVISERDKNNPKLRDLFPQKFS